MHVVARTQVNYTETSKLQKLLPWRGLRDGDRPPFIEDLTPGSNTVIALLVSARPLSPHSAAYTRLRCSFASLSWVDLSVLFLAIARYTLARPCPRLAHQLCERAQAPRVRPMHAGRRR